MSLETEVDIVNSALTLLGQDGITALTDNSKRAETANIQYGPTRDYLLTRSHWNFAAVRVVLNVPVTDYKTITNISKASPAELSIVDHGFDTGDTIYLESVEGMPLLNGKRYKADVKTVNTLDIYELDNTPVDTTGFPDYVTDSGTAREVPAYGPKNRIPLPGDFLRIDRSEYADTPWNIESGHIMTDDDTISFTYQAKITDVAEMDEVFKAALVSQLAARMAQRLVGQGTLYDRMQDLAREQLREAIFADTAQRSRTTVGGRTWTDGRLTQTSEFQPSGWANSQ